MSFAALDLDPQILSTLKNLGYETATPIQSQAIPVVLAGHDLIASAQTGTGKTASFTLPLLQALKENGKPKPNTTKALILVPTRELANQVYESIQNYGRDLDLRTQVVYGGVKINPQMMQLRKGTDILVATPGRLLDLAGQNAIKFNQLSHLILDEADRMLDMGFLPDIKRIIAQLPTKRQTLLFSATFPTEIESLCKNFLKNPKRVSVSPSNTTVKAIEQKLHPVDKKKKTPLIAKLINEHQWYQLLVFVRTKRGANKLTNELEKSGIHAAAIHGNKSQSARTRVLKEFKAGKLQVLIATDIAARGLDIDQLPIVVNFDLPDVAEDYVHRIGRTGRAGAKGYALSLVAADEADKLAAIQNLIKEKIEREYVSGFEPQHELPETPLRAFKKKAPNKSKPSSRTGSGNSRTKPQGKGSPPKKKSSTRKKVIYKGKKTSPNKAAK